MFYQDNNDYMRDSYFYGNGVNSNCPYGNNMMYGNMQNPYMQNNFQMPMQNQTMSLENMYPQIYKIITPVASRVISNSNYQYMTEDVLNNMVDTVYNIVEGDVSSLINNNSSVQGDDTVATSTNSNINNSRTQSSTSNSNANGRGNNSSMDNQTNSNELLKDLIKILLIKELIARRNSNNNFMGQQNMQMGNYNYIPYGI